MTTEQATLQALKIKLKSRYLEARGQMDLDFIQLGIDELVDELKNQEVPQLIADVPDLFAEERAKTQKVTNEITTEAIKRGRAALYEVLSEYIENLEFDPDAFISGIAYWYELQALAKAYGKKLLYVTPKKKEAK